MVSLKSSLFAALALATATFAQSSPPVSDYCTSSGVCGAINVPSSGTDTYFQIKGLKSTGWASIGVGSRMSGSMMFVIYPSSDGTNVTVSARLGKGHSNPQYSSSVKIQVLDGSGINGDTMTANFKCSNCRSWSGGSLNVQSSNQNFIWAYGPGVAISSDSPTQSIDQHYGQGNFQLDVASATGGDGSTNPFFVSSGSTATTGGASTGTGSGSSTAATGTSTSTHSGSTSGGNAGSSGAAPLSQIDKILIAHGVIMGVTWVIFFPLGAAFIRLLSNHIPNAFMMHRMFQGFNVILSIIGMGLGMWYSGINQTHFRDFHQYFGVFLIGMLFVQGALGQLHHAEFQRIGKRSSWSYMHIWVGRSVIAGGIVNSGIGLGPELAGASGGQIALFSIVSLAVVGTYVFFYFLQQSKSKQAWRV